MTRVQRKQRDELAAEVKRLRTLQNHMSERLERIIYSLQNELTANRERTGSGSLDSLMFAIAELKQVKDILLGLLAEDSFVDLLPSDPPAAAHTDPLGVAQFPVASKPTK
jgi:hypothetical protein